MRKGSKRRSRKSFGSIKDMGLKQKIINGICFFMKRNSRIGVFLTIEVLTELIGLVTLVSAIVMLIKIGFPLQAVILLLLNVSIDTNENSIFDLKSIQYFGVTVFFLQTKGDKVFGAKTGPKKWLMNLGLLMVAPMVPLLVLRGFVY